MRGNSGDPCWLEKLAKKDDRRIKPPDTKDLEARSSKAGEGSRRKVPG